MLKKKVPTKQNSDYVNNCDKTVIFCLLNSEVNSMNIFESLEYEVMWWYICNANAVISSVVVKLPNSEHDFKSKIV